MGEWINHPPRHLDNYQYRRRETTLPNGAVVSREWEARLGDSGTWKKMDPEASAKAIATLEREIVSPELARGTELKDTERQEKLKADREREEAIRAQLAKERAEYDKTGEWPKSEPSFFEPGADEDTPKETTLPSLMESGAPAVKDADVTKKRDQIAKMLKRQKEGKFVRKKKLAKLQEETALEED